MTGQVKASDEASPNWLERRAGEQSEAIGGLASKIDAAFSEQISQAEARGDENGRAVAEWLHLQRQWLNGLSAVTNGCVEIVKGSAGHALTPPGAQHKIGEMAEWALSVQEQALEHLFAVNSELPPA